MPAPSGVPESLAGRYRPERLLGRGGMAWVYQARDLRHDRDVALKVLRPELAAFLGAERFLNEIRVTASLDHPHIITLLDSGEDGGLLWYVLPLIRGESLRERLDRERQLGVDEALEILRDIAGALDHAHAHGVIHRDVKPGNVLMHEGEAMLADFGIALALQEAGGVRLTETGLTVGTPQYMSPEQAGGESGLDGRSDSYALACVAYEMLGGTPPFTGPTPRAILARHSLDPVPPITTLRPGLAPAVEEVFSRGLAKAPADRYPSASGFVEALAAALQSPAPGTPARRRPGVSRLLLGTVAMTGILVFAWRVVLGGHRAPLASLAVLPLANLSGDAAQDYLGDGLQDGIIGELGRVGGLRVISRTSTRQYRESDKPAPEIARELGVDGLLEGSARQSGDSVQLRVRLIRASGQEEELWSGTYLRDLRDLLNLQREVAVGVARAVGLSAGAGAAPGEARQVNPALYEAYVRGMFYVNQFSDSGFDRGLALLHQANALDPADPLPYIGLAQAYSVLGHGPRPDVLPRAREAARRALELDPGAADAYAVLAEAYMYADWDFPRAGEAFERALALNPNLPATQAHYSWYLHMLGRRPESLAAMERAVALDPLSAMYASWLSWIRWAQGDNDGAIRDARHSLELRPDFPVAWHVIGGALLAKGDTAGALSAHRTLAATSPAWRWSLGYTEAATGRVAEAKAVVADLARDVTPMAAWGLAEIAVALGDKEAGLRWLDSAVALRWSWVPWTRVDTALTPLRGDPRFEALLARLHIPGPEAGGGPN